MVNINVCQTVVENILTTECHLLKISLAKKELKGFHSVVMGSIQTRITQYIFLSL